MKKLLAAMLVIVLLFTVAIPRQEANADAMTLAIIGGAALAVGVGAGLIYTTSDMTASQMQGYITGRLQNYINRNGGSFTEWLAGEYVRHQAGKLIIPATLYNKIKNFLNSEIQENEITTTSKQIALGSFLGYDVLSWDSYLAIKGINEGYEYMSTPASTGLSVCLENGYMKVYMDGILKGQQSVTRANYTGWNVYLNQSGFLNVGAKQSQRVTEQGELKGTVEYLSVNINSYKSQMEGYTVSAVLDDYNDGAIDPGYQWEGSVYEGADTNLEDLIQDIFDRTVANDLVVDEDVVADNPPVNPEATNPPATDIPGQLDGIQEGINDIAGTIEGVQEGVGEAVGQLEGINEGVGSIGEALEVPTASEAPAFKFDLTTLFPFCIPFDIYRFVTMFSASPVAPHVQIPFNIPAVGLQYTFDLDFSSFNSVASVLRSVELIAFCVGLAILTSKVIRW